MSPAAAEREPLEDDVPGIPAAVDAPAAPGGTDAEGGMAPGRPWARRLAGNLAWNLASELAARGASLWLAFACARALPVAGFGRFAFALALTQYVWLAGDAFANAGYATREVARVRARDLRSARRLKGRILLMRLAAAAGLTLLTALAVAFVPMAPELRGAIAGASLFFLAYAAFPDWALRAREDFRGLAFANVAAALALVAGTLLWLPRHPGPGTAAALWSGSFAIAAAVALVRLARARAFTWSGQGGAVGAHARRSLVFSLGAIAGIGCAQAPMLIVGVLATPEGAGLFGAGYRFLLLAINAFAVLWWPLLPVLVRSRPGERDFREALATMSGVVLALALPAALAFALWPRELVTLAFGARYAGAAPVLRIAAAVVPLFAATALLEQTSLALGGEAARARINAAAFAVLVALGVAWVPRHGPGGAAAALVLAYAVSAAGYAFACRRELPWAEMAARSRGPLALNVLLATSWCSARALGAPAPVAIGAALVLYPLLAMHTGVLPRPRWGRA